MHDAFFSPKFSKCARYFSPKNLECAHHFFQDVKNRGRSQQPNVLGQLVTSEPQHTRINRPKESIATNATFLTVFLLVVFTSSITLITLFT